MAAVKSTFLDNFTPRDYIFMSLKYAYSGEENKTSINRIWF